MTDPHDALAETFAAQRTRLEAVAFRMLGSRADAEDAVQEAWLRLDRTDAAAIDSIAAWLTTVVGRICLDMLRSRRSHAETSYGDEVPELVVTDDVAAPEENSLLAESVGLAMLVVLETLNPAERLAFVLHDMFAVPFAEIGPIVGKSTDAAKMLASRARRKVRGHRDTESPRGNREVVDAFLAAARGGDFEALVALLDPDVAVSSHNARGTVTRSGAAQVARQIMRGARAVGATRPVLVNGEPGVVAWRANGGLLGIVACTVVDGRITAMVTVSDPKRLAGMDLPEAPA
ncbi:MAG TPA: sigma-70 family RNA polymerase sigma factor [Stackebrandtia sp.]|jgi:RNA polymerase sigma-70 factor (ECF subfamily)|uniref:sigma-70 family RNA polymerase sigma factor n=1 Tax=Stackebrandtia sp. TaxID=2023065 RepID=UPI002D34F816|nr:sigma-70 family RNA polymerase sigma factor [Stackebrandtia sp.]HZE37342.1 sigma-70 family RNA polymerase sigma factor [Stackebrandtia sp.]